MSIDVAAYCRRIGYAGEPAPTLECLRALHRLHPQSFAFENLNPLLDIPVPLDPPSLEKKMIHGGRGGYCFEQNLLFGYALKAIGFNVRELTARVRWRVPAGAVLPRSHMLLLLDVAGEEYIADVGFGSTTLTGPLLLRSRAEQQTPHEPFRLAELDGKLTVQVRIRGEWDSLYYFDLIEQLLPDLEVANWYTSTHPNSRFRRELIVTRAEPDRRYALLNNELAEHRIFGETTRRALRSVAEIREVLTGAFKLTLPGSNKLDGVLARFAGDAT